MHVLLGPFLKPAKLPVTLDDFNGLVTRQGLEFLSHMFQVFRQLD